MLQVPHNVDFQGSELLDREEEIGSGFIYGAVAGLNKEGNQQGRDLGVLGFVFYDTVTQILSHPTWSLDAARKSLVKKPSLSKVIDCDADSSSSPFECSGSSTIEIVESHSITKGRESTTSYTYEYNKRFGMRQSAVFKFEAKLPFIGGKDQEYGLETSQEWSMTETWGNSVAEKMENTYSKEERKSSQCAFKGEIAAGQRGRISFQVKKGEVDVAYNGNMTYLLKSGAKFSFPMKGVFKSTAFSSCSGKLE